MTAAECAIEGCPRPARSKGLCHSHYERSRRTGTAGGPLRAYGAAGCSVPGCPKPHKAVGLCALHYTRLKQFGDVNRSKQMPAGPAHWNWAGDAADYTTVHQRLTKYRGLATSYACAHCGHPADEWAYDNADPAERIAQSGAAKNCRYSTDLDHYLPAMHAVPQTIRPPGQGLACRQPRRRGSTVRFGLVPDHAKDARPWARAVNIGPPPGLEDQVAFVEALVDDQTEFGRAFRVFAYPTPEELELIVAGRPIEFTVIAPQLVPISAQVY